jgi:hypothetical protein
VRVDRIYNEYFKVFTFVWGKGFWPRFERDFISFSILVGNFFEFLSLWGTLSWGRLLIILSY